MKSCINGVTFIRFLLLLIKLFKFEIQKCGQILCAHKPCFLMPGHIYTHIFNIVHCKIYVVSIVAASDVH